MRGLASPWQVIDVADDHNGLGMGLADAVGQPAVLLGEVRDQFRRVVVHVLHEVITPHCHGNQVGRAGEFDASHCLAVGGPVVQPPVPPSRA